MGHRQCSNYLLLHKNHQKNIIHAIRISLITQTPMLEIQPELRRDNLFLPHSVWGLSWKDSKTDESHEGDLSWVFSGGCNRVAGGGVISKVLSHTYLEVDVRCCWNLSWASEHLDSESPCGLGFVTAWQLQSTWTSYMVAQVSKGVCPKRTGRKLWALFCSSCSNYWMPLLPHLLG